MTGPLDPLDPTRPTTEDDAGELPETLRNIKTKLVDHEDRIEDAETAITAAQEDITELQGVIDGVILHTTTLSTPGSGTFNKPVDPEVYTNPESLIVRVRGVAGGGSGGCVLDGGSGDPAVAIGGGGGGCIEITMPYESFPSTMDYTVPAGGASRVRTTNGQTAGEDGGDVEFTISGIVWGATGGKGGATEYPDPGNTTVVAGAAGGYPKRDGQLFEVGLLYGGGHSGEAQSTNAPLESASVGSASVNGGGAGGSAARYSGVGNAAVGTYSATSGNGGDGDATNDNAVGVAGTAPGGGGGAACGRLNPTTSGAGGNGRIVITIERRGSRGMIHLP
jgi:hypothetical protein